MKGSIKKQINRLWRATEERRVFPAHWEWEDEVIKPAKPIRGKLLQCLLAGENYKRLEAEDGSRCWLFAERPKFRANELYYIQLIHENDKPDFMVILRAS